MNPFRRSPDARFLRALWLSQNWAAMRGNQRAEDPLTYAYAKFLFELNQNMGHVEQERHMALRPVLASVYWLMSAAPDWRASLLQRRGFGQEPVWPLNRSGQDTSINVILQHERSIIKALVLADATPELIASQLDYDVQTIEIFEKMCWDVRGKSTARAWLHNYVFPEGIQATIDSGDFERMVLQRAYTHGLDGVLKFLHLTGHVTDPKKHAVEVSAMNSSDLVDRSTATIQGLHTGGRNGPEILATVLGAEKAEKDFELKRKAAEGGDNASNTDEEAAKLLLAKMIVVGRDGFQVADPAVPSDLGAEEHLDDSRFQETLSKVLQEVQLTP